MPTDVAVPRASSRISDVSRLGRSFGPLVAGQFGNAGATFLALSLLARFLGPTGYGDFAVFLAAVLVMTQLSDLGLGRAMTLFGSRSGALGDDATRVSMYATGLAIRLSSIVVAGVALVLLALAAAPLRTPVLGYLALGGLGGLATALTVFEAGVLQAERRFGELATLTLLPGLLRVALVLGLHYGGRLDLTTGMLAYTASQAAPGVLFLVRLPVGRGWLGDAARHHVLAIWGVTRWIALAAIVEMFSQRVDIFGLRVLSDARQTGIYAGSFLFVSVINVLITAVNSITYPAMAAAGARGDTAELRRTFAAGTSLLAAVGVPAVLAVVTGFPDVVSLYLGEQYRHSVEVVDILGVYGVVAVVQYNTGGLYLAAGRPRLVSGMTGLLLALNLTGILLLVPRLGAVGAAAAVTIGMGLLLPISWWWVSRLIGRALPVRHLATAALVGALGLAACALVPDQRPLAALAVKGVIWFAALSGLVGMLARDAAGLLSRT